MLLDKCVKKAPMIAPVWAKLWDHTLDLGCAGTTDVKQLSRQPALPGPRVKGGLARLVKQGNKPSQQRKVTCHHCECAGSRQLSIECVSGRQR